MCSQRYKKIIVANWKAGLSPAEAKKWLAVFKEHNRPDPALRLVLAPSFLHLPLFRDEFSPQDGIALAAAYFAELSGRWPVPYGGGMHAGNIATFMSVPNLAGVMTAAATLDPHRLPDFPENAGRAAANHV